MVIHRHEVQRSELFMDIHYNPTLKNQRQTENFESIERRRRITCQGILIRTPAMSPHTHRVGKRDWRDIFKVLKKKKNCQPRILYSEPFNIFF